MITECIRCGEAIPEEDQGGPFCSLCSTDVDRALELHEADAIWYQDDPPEERERQLNKAKAYWKKNKRKVRDPDEPQDQEKLTALSQKNVEHRRTVELSRERRFGPNP